MLLLNVAFFTATVVAMEPELDPSVKSSPIAIIAKQEQKEEESFVAGSLDLLSEQRRKAVLAAHYSAIQWKSQQLHNERGDKKPSAHFLFLVKKNKGTKPSPLCKVESAGSSNKAIK